MTSVLFENHVDERTLREFSRSYVLPLEITAGNYHDPTVVDWKDLFRFDPDVANAAIGDLERAESMLHDAVAELEAWTNYTEENVEIRIENLPEADQNRGVRDE